MAGDTYNTQMQLIGNQSDVAAQAVHLTQMGVPESHIFTNESLDISLSREIYNVSDYRAFLDLTDNFTTDITTADYAEIGVNFDSSNNNSKFS